MSMPIYDVVSSKDIPTLVQAVNSFIKLESRWAPTGGPFHVIDGTPGGTWYQAVYWKE